MNLAYKKILGKFTKVLGFGKTPPPCWEKFPNNIVFFCLTAYLIWFGVYSFCNLESTWASSALFAVAVQTTKVALQRGYCSSNCMQQAITKLKTSVTTFANACFSKDSFQLRLPEQYNLQYMLKAA